jgi:hypothetical protein
LHVGKDQARSVQYQQSDKKKVFDGERGGCLNITHILKTYFSHLVACICGMDDMQESEANHFHPFSLSITPFTLKMPTKHTTKLVELHLDDIRRVVLLNISLFPIAMSVCGLRKPQLKATRQSYNAH